jgi:hypothetical protein
MDESLIPSRTGTSQLGKPLPPTSQIAMALTAMAANRGGEWNPASLAIVTETLSTEPLEDLLAVIKAIGLMPRRDHEPAIPNTGTIVQAVRALRHPHKHLREIVTKLARIFHETADEDFLMLYQEEAGHRTDADLDKAYKAIRGDDSLKKMPTPSQFRAQCGIPKVYRDGTRPA